MQIDTFIPITLAKAKLLDLVREIHDQDRTVAITKNGIPEMVMLSIEQYESIRETLAVLADEMTMAQFRASLEEEKEGKPFVDLEDID
jgi:antitoxin YefM